MHVEDEGTFTQQDGITQRFRKAYPAKQDVQAHWRWAADMFAKAQDARPFVSSRDVFRAAKANVSEFASFDWDAAAPRSQKTAGINPLPASADGRPPGWREMGAPRIRGE